MCSDYSAAIGLTNITKTRKISHIYNIKLFAKSSDIVIPRFGSHLFYELQKSPRLRTNNNRRSIKTRSSGVQLHNASDRGWTSARGGFIMRTFK